MFYLWFPWQPEELLAEESVHLSVGTALLSRFIELFPLKQQEQGVLSDPT